MSQEITEQQLIIDKLNKEIKNLKRENNELKKNKIDNDRLITEVLKIQTAVASIYVSTKEIDKLINQ